MLDVEVDEKDGGVGAKADPDLDAPAIVVAVPARAGTKRPNRVRRFVERLLLGAVMTVIAAVLDRRLRRMFAKR